MFACIIDPDRTVQASELSAMAAALRGGAQPASIWRDEIGAIGVVSASAGLLPEDAFDAQPIVTTDLVFAAQARIDNRDEVLERLGVPRPDWPRTADAGVLYLAYAKWGEDCLAVLAGDYAFVAWRRDTGQVFAATDHVGSVPLFYAQCGRALILSTQLRSLLACRRVDRTLDTEALGLLAAPRIISGRTPYRHVCALIGGHGLNASEGRVQQRRWWSPSNATTLRYRNPQDYVEHVREVFGRAVADRLRATTEVSALLSGGLDSSLVAATAARQLGATGRRITAYTAITEPDFAWAIPGGDTEDWPYARLVAAAHDNIDHLGLGPGGRCTLDIAGAIHAGSGAPLRNGANNLWMDSILTHAREAGRRVMLVGDRGNAGLSYAGDGALRELFLRGAWLKLGRLAWRGAEGDSRRMAELLLRELAPGLHAHRPFRTGVTPPLRPGAAFLTPAFRTSHTQALAVSAADASRRARLQFMLGPIRRWSADPVIQWGVETRDPTADRRLIELLLSFPLDAFLVDGRRRGLARALGRGSLPEAVRLRRVRGIQMAELGAIMKHHASTYRVLLDQVAELASFREIFELDAVEAAFTRVDAGGAKPNDAYGLDRVAGVGLFMLGERG